jgi:hypothetical protein
VSTDPLEGLRLAPAPSPPDEAKEDFLEKIDICGMHYEHKCSDINCAVLATCQSDEMSTANNRENILSLGK